MGMDTINADSGLDMRKSVSWLKYRDFDHLDGQPKEEP